MKHKIMLEFDDQTEPISCGFRQNWIEGKDKKTGTEINLSCGAGVGSPWLVFSKTVQGKIRYAVADIRPLINKLAELLVVK